MQRNLNFTAYVTSPDNAQPLGKYVQDVKKQTTSDKYEEVLPRAQYRTSRG